MKGKQKQVKQTTRERRLRLIEIIESCEGKPCPTDAQFSELLGFDNPGSAAGILSQLYVAGAVRNIGDKKRRQLEVVSSGKKTAPAVSRWR